MGLIALCVFIATFVPKLFNYRNIDGIINARTMTLRSPIEGIFEFNGEIPLIGAHIQRGQVIGFVKNIRLNKSYLYELITEKNSLLARVTALDVKIVSLEAIRETLVQRLNVYQHFTLASLNDDLDSLKMVQEQIAVIEKFGIEELERQQALLLTGAVSVSEHGQIRTERERLRFKFRENQHQITSINHQIEAIKQFVFLGEGHNDVPYASQRMDEIDITLASVSALQKEAERRIVMIADQLIEEENRLKEESVYKVVSPFDGILWRLPITQGSTVVIDTELIKVIDCNNVFIEALSQEKHFDEFQKDQSVKYRLYGNNQYHTGTIVAVQGSGFIPDKKNLAAALDTYERKENRVLIELDPEQNISLNTTFCQVGRRVVVLFPRQWDFTFTLKRLANVF